ncbi:MAG: hypothetical protein KBS66_00725 [Eubacterium sp.]|nr:hypothetical protein [Candidatus Colimonas fimequi]
MTNAERIRHMSLKELAEFMNEFEDDSCKFCAEIGCEYPDDRNCRRGYENWLKQSCKKGKTPQEIIKILHPLSSTSDISCIVASNGELFIYTTAEVDGATMLRLAKAVKNGTTIHIAK